MSRAAAIAGMVLALAAFATVAAFAALGFVIVIGAVPVCTVIDAARMLAH